MDLIIDIFGTLLVGLGFFCALAPLIFICMIIRDLFTAKDRRWRPWQRLKAAVRRAFEYVTEGILSLIQ